MKAVAETLEVARSHLHEKSIGWQSHAVIIASRTILTSCPWSAV